MGQDTGERIRESGLENRAILGHPQASRDQVPGLEGEWMGLSSDPCFGAVLLPSRRIPFISPSIAGSQPFFLMVLKEGPLDCLYNRISGRL